jgi:hypothetical protein
MSLEHSPSRQKKSSPSSAAPFAPPLLEALYTRDEVAARYRHTATWVTRNYRRLGLQPAKYGKRQLFPHSQLVELDRRALAGEVEILCPAASSATAEAGTP